MSNRKRFSLRLVVIYTCLVIVPVSILFVCFAAIVKKNTMAGLDEICRMAVEENVRQIGLRYESILRIDQMVQTNSELTLFLTIPERYEEEELISMLRTQTEGVERILFADPSLYGVRIFMNNSAIPERFPVFVHAERTGIFLLNRWELNYIVNYMGYLSPQYERSLCYTRALMNGARNVGYLQVAMRMKDAFPFVYREEEPFQHDYIFRLRRSEGGDGLVAVDNGGLETYNAPLSEDDLARFAAAYLGGTDRAVLKLGGDRVTARWRTVPFLDMVVLHTCSLRSVSANVLLICLMALAGIVIFALGTFVLINFITARMLTGVYSIMNGMREVSGGNLSVTIPVTHYDEVGEAQRAFNAMTALLNEQIAQIKREQRLIIDTEMKALQNQINAHFLYNVLETIHMQAVLQDAEDTAEAILALGKMMRYCLRWRVLAVPLSQELEYINAYIYILNIRNDYVITLDADIPESYMHVTIPKMMLQPFVENAFVHAIEPAAQDAVIRVYAEEEGARLWLCVQDYGCGIAEERLAAIRSYLADESYEKDTKGSIGIKNIQQRLAMYYGGDYRLDILSAPGKGTLIRVPVSLNGGIKYDYNRDS